MKGSMNHSNLRRTPKVFGTSYRPQAKKASQLSIVKTRAWKPIVIVAGVALAFFLVARLPIFQIKSVTVEGAVSAELAAELQGLVGHSIFSGQITRVTSRWLVGDQSLAALNCRRGIPNTVRCRAVNRTGVVVWRQGGNEFWVDESGRAFARYQPTESASLVVEDRGAPVEIGSDVASSEIISVFLRLRDRLVERSIGVKHFFVADVLYQPGVVISSFPVTGQPVLQKDLTILFAATESVDAQVQTLASLLATRGVNVASRIDLRVPGYVYYH